MEKAHPSLEIKIAAPWKKVSYESPEFSWMAFSLRLLELKMTKKNLDIHVEDICKGASATRDGNAHD
jgi:hypothetical protein